MTLPDSGRPPADVLADLRALRAADAPTVGGRTWAYVYDAGSAEHDELTAAAFLEMLPTNALDPTAFTSTAAVENGIVAATREILGGGPATAGIVTSGGTESILLAVKSARDLRPDVERPAIVVPETAHPSFRKAAHYLGLDVVEIAVDAETFRADPASLRDRLDERAVLVVGSAPSYPHGVIDPIEELARIASEAGVAFHVDACVGGFLLPFQRENGDPVPPFDLSVPGVTSISADVHKYNYTPKGASVVLFADAERRRAAYFASARWAGYPVINPTIQSARTAGGPGAAWASLQHLGRDGLRRVTAEAREAAVRIVAGVETIDGIRVLGTPESVLVAIASDDPAVDIHVVIHEARTRGFGVQTQLSYGASPASLHLSADAGSLPVVDDLLEVLAASVAAARVQELEPLPEGLAEGLQGLDPSFVTEEVLDGFAAAAGVDTEDAGTGGPLVDRILDVAPPAIREVLVERFYGRLFPG
ncbi:aspartate aminotransferase family protein [Patulibacter sp.]|uniref:pyridoxal phosphate-dependent decarboxylase family protein n=1 Tax=Patulibacter sp. TaxID=1912859 RepID=UPI00271E4889|nr:aspartate aminotransferase family protein [Patulibacter sp.]MDO9408978.1 aspartate aminotransferase family protein [Patulibacter sp.]